MALWPFRRRSRRKRPRSGNQSESEGASRETLDDQNRARRRKTELNNHGTSQLQPPALVPNKKQPNKLHRRDTRYSFEEGRDDDLVVHHQKTSRKRAPGVPSQGPVDPRSNQYSKESGLLHTRGSAVLDNHTFLRMPTLHNKRDGEHLARNKKSSKRRKADHAREAEIKAMSSFEPVRPAAEPWQLGRPLKTDTKRLKTGLGLGFRRSWEKEHPTSNVSLPVQGSIHSSLTSDSEQVSFTVSTLEALAPRPTLSYTVHPRNSTSPTALGRHVSIKHKLSGKEPIPEATIKAHKRIDDLADDLTASDLRELMERDERRRARKREQDQQRMEERLRKRAEKERAAQSEGGDSPPNLERGVLGRESVGLGIKPESAVDTSSRQRTSPSPTAKKLGKRPAEAMEDEDDHEAASHVPHGPLEHFHRIDSIPLAKESLVDLPGDTLSSRPVPVRAESPRKRVALMSEKARSRSPQPSEPAKTDASDSLRKVSGTSSVSKARRSWSNIFRWGSRSKQNSGPSSFSNTSRDSMSTHHAHSAAIPAALSRKISSTVPKRTMSRFREDLPELPVSPPQSPGLGTMPPATIVEQESPEIDAHADREESTPKRRDTPMSPDDEPTGSVPASIPTSVDPSPEPATMSLGSVDTEGSWFGKKATPRRTLPTPVTPPHFEHQRTYSISSEGSSHHDPDLPTEEIPDEEGAYIADDEYLSRLAHDRSSDSQMTNARPSSDEFGDARWGTVGGHQPKVVTGDFVRSREGLLNTFSEEDDGSDSEPEEAVADEEGKEEASMTGHNTSAELEKTIPQSPLGANGRVSTI